MLQKLASKLGGGDENLQQKVDQLTLALGITLIEEKVSGLTPPLPRLTENDQNMCKEVPTDSKVPERLVTPCKFSETSVTRQFFFNRCDPLEDMSMCCQLSGYRQDLITFTDQLLQELGSAEAILTVKTRTPSLPSGHNIQQYFTSFTKGRANLRTKKIYFYNWFYKHFPLATKMEKYLNDDFFVKAMLFLG